ncbi:MAG TPA: GAF domain-containing protein [Candidatus Eisenbacteria bacterium]
MPSAVRKVGFICLPDRQLDIFSEITRRGEFRPEVVVDSNPASCAFKMAEILEIPASGDLELLRRYPCDLLVIPDDRPDLQVDVCRVLGSALAGIMTGTEMATLLDLRAEGSATEEPSSTWMLPLPAAAAAAAAETATATAPQASSPAQVHRDMEDDSPLQIERHPLERVDAVFENVDAPEVQEEAPRSGHRDYELEVIADPAWFDTAAHASGDLKRISETLDLAGDQQRLLKRILEIAVNTAGGDSGSIMLLDESGQHLRIVVADGLSDEVIRKTSQRRGEGVAGQVLRDGRARVLVDKLDDPRYRSGRERSGIQSAISAPIQVAGRTIGVLNVSSDSRPNAFTAHSLEQMERFGSEVAEVLLRALKPAGGERPLARSFEIAVESLMTLDRPLDHRLEAVLHKLATGTRAAAGRLYLLDGTGRRLDVAAEFGSAAPGSRRSTVMADRGFTARALDRNESTVLTSTIDATGPRALLLLPLRGAEPMGLIELEDLPAEEPGWSERLEALTQAAARLTTRLEFERSQVLLTRRTRQMLRLSDLSGGLLSATSAGELNRLAVEAAAEIVDADLAILRRPDSDNLELSDADFAIGDPEGQRLLLLDAEFGELAALGGRVVSLDECPTLLEERLGNEAGVRWALALPIPGIPGGVLSVYRRKGTALAGDSEDRALLVRLSASLGQTLVRMEAGELPGGDTDRFMRWTVFQERIAEEMKRADRYNRTFALVTLELEGIRAMAESAGGDWLEGARFALTDFVLNQIRELDIPCWVREGRVAIICPDTSELGDSLADRLSEEWRKLLPSLPLAGLDRMAFNVNETIYPLDRRDWESMLDWAADRFDTGDTRQAS